MKTILIPVDFTNTANRAVDYALQLFQNEKVNYILLNAFHVKAGPDKDCFAEEKTKHQSDLDKAEKILKQKVNAESTVKSILWLGEITFLPKEIIEDNNVDLVLMGTEGVDAVEEYIGKSHAGEFVSHVDVDTLIVPSCVKYEVPQNILFTTNYKNEKEEGALALLKEFVTKHDSNVFVLHVNNTGVELTTHEETVKKQLKEYFEDSKVSFHEFTADNVEIEIENFMLEYNIDMVSAIPLHNTFFERIFHNSLARKLTEHAIKPVLILTNKCK